MEKLGHLIELMTCFGCGKVMSSKKIIDMLLIVVKLGHLIELVTCFCCGKGKSSDGK